MIPRIDQLNAGELRKILLEQQAILENATAGILFSRNRVVAACNALCAEMFGYAPEELIGLSAQSLYPTADAYAEHSRVAGPALAAGQPYHAEIQYRRKDGVLFWCRVSAKAVDPLSPQDGTIWMIEDVGEERAIREALAKATQELETVFETSPLGIAVLRHGRVVRCNRSFELLFGHAVGEMTGKASRLLCLSEEESADVEQHPDLDSGSGNQSEQRFFRQDGSSFWGRLSGRAFDPAQPGEGSVWMLEDITERKDSDDRVRAALAEQELIFNNAAVGMVFVRNRIVRRCNRKFEDIFGYAPGQLIGNSTLVFYPTVRDYDEHWDHVYAQLCRGETVSREERLRRQDGSLFWARTTGRKTDAPGLGLDVIWIFEDVSGRHHAEEALLKAQNEMEQRVVERTTALTTSNQQLQAEIFERMEAEQRIWHIAHHDALTGLPNRSLLHDRLDQALTQAARSEHRLAVMFLDLDRFKSVNDTLGHHVGDQLLKHVAERLREAVRAVDIVSRLGGDEFVVILPEIQDPGDASRVAQKIIAALAPAVMLDGNLLHATPSIGISIFPDHGTAAYGLMKHADTAMYHAKADGRNTFRFYEAEMNSAGA